jgi:hypothetical protein
LAASQLRPLNAAEASGGPLTPPVFCPGLSGPVSPALQRVLNNLPGHPCQQTQAALAVSERLAEKS